MAAQTNLVGKTFTVISQTDFRLVLEEDEMGAPGQSVVVIDCESIPDASHGLLKVRSAR